MPTLAPKVARIRAGRRQPLSHTDVPHDHFAIESRPGKSLLTFSLCAWAFDVNLTSRGCCLRRWKVGTGKVTRRDARTRQFRICISPDQPLFLLKWTTLLSYLIWRHARACAAAFMGCNSTLVQRPFKPLISEKCYQQRPITHDPRCAVLNFLGRLYCCASLPNPSLRQ